MIKNKKYGIFPILAISVIVLSMSSIVANYTFQKNSFYKQELKKIKLYQEHYQENIDYDSKLLYSFIKLIKNNTKIEKYLINKDRKKLEDSVKNLYETLNHNNDVTHLYFMDTNGKVLLRAHDTSRHSDVIDRYTFKQVKKTQKAFHGLEFGIKNNYTLRVVEPWIVNGKLVGYIELGKEIDKIIESAGFEFKIDTYYAIYKDYYQKSNTNNDTSKRKYETNNHYIVYNTAEIPRNIDELVNIGHKKMQWMEIDDKNIIVYTSSLIDISGESIGDILYLINIEKEYNDLTSEIKKDVIFMTLATFLLLFIGYFFAMGKQKKIDELMENLESEIEKQTHDINQQKAAFETLFEKAPYGSLIIVNDRFYQCNEKVIEILGYKSKEDFLNSTPANLSPQYQPDGQSSFEKSQKMNAIAYEKGVNQFEWVHTRANGEDFWCDVVLTPISLPGLGDVLHVLWRDISKQKDNELDLEREREDLEAALKNLEKTNIELDKAIKASEIAIKTKADFLANMSHEIRTPMNAILGMSHLALQGNLDAREKNYIEKVHRSADMLLGIINDILDFSKIDADQLNIENINFSISDVLDDLVSIVELNAKEKDVEFMYWLDENLATEFVGDPLRLGQVLLNLVGNAIKFSEKNGEVLVNIDIDEDYGQEVLLHFSIKDNGIGMSSDNLDKLFKAFSQADTSTTRKYGGTGLGLIISKKLVELMGGKIWVDSELGKGSTFHFTVQLKKQQNPTKEHEGGIDSIFKNINILLVDDNNTSRMILLKILKHFGFSAQEAVNGESAVKMLKEKDFDLIITDWKMDKMDGVEMVRYIQNDKTITKQPKIIMITAHGAEDAIAASKDLDIKQFIPKPVNFSKVHDAIVKAISHTASENGKKILLEHKNSKVISKLNGAHLLLVEDNEVNQELAIDLLNSIGISVALANNGQEAIDKLEDEEFDGILMDCHMPVLDGYEATKKIRQDKRYKDIPIIALTANVLSDDKKKALDSGMNDQISKPIRPVDMFDTLAKWIKHSRKSDTQDLYKNSSDDGVYIPDIDGIDISKGLTITLNDKNVYLKLLKKFKDNQDSFERDFRAAFESKDMQTATRIAHTLKGLAGNIGATNLQEKAAELEKLSIDNSDHNEIENALIEVVNVLEPIMQELSKLQERPAIAITTDELLDKEELSRLLKEIKTLAEDDDTEALEYCAKLKNLKGIQAFSKKIDLLIENIESYAFTEAIDIIKIIEKEVNSYS